MEQFRVIKEIGKGGYGKALLVRSLQTNDLRVVKEMNLGSMTREARKNAMKEAEILSTLKHTNIIRYRNCTVQKKKLFILMDYADGGDIAKAIKNQKAQPFPEDQILDWFVQICLALKYLHDRKILHRDLKPQNVFLSSGSIIKLGDFGIAKALEHTGDMAKTLIGTPMYCSPEICIGHQYNAKSDIWSLGCILYELISLKKPFNGTNIGDITRRIMYRNPSPLPAQYSEEIKVLTLSMLAKKPEQRPSINKIFKLPLIRNKAIALLGKTLAKSELSHGVYHGTKPGETPENAIDDIQYLIGDQEAQNHCAKKAGIMKEMQEMALNLQQIMQDDNLVDIPEDLNDLNEGEFYFMGRKLVLKNVKPTDPLSFKIESIRVFLEELLGIDKFIEIYQFAQTPESDGEKLLKMTKSDVYVFQLIMQLVAYEKLQNESH